MKAGTQSFLITHMNRISDIKKQLVEETIKQFPKESGMISSPDQCEHMKFLVQATRSKKGIEIGVFTGYSALCLAEGLPEDGKLIALDISEKFTNLGRQFWKLGNQDHKIDLIIAPAIETLNKIIETQSETFDFAYIDADKNNYPHYYDKAFQLLKSGGFMMFDNVLWGGGIANIDQRTNDLETKSLYETVQKTLNDPRVSAHTINLADGFMVVYKK